MCDCDVCNFSKRVSSLREFLVESGNDELLKTLDDLYCDYVHQSMDYDVLLAVVDNKWPSSELQMKEKGWVREKEESV